MSKRNTESLKAFFNRCSERVEGFDPMTVEVQGEESILCGQIMCKRGDLYLMAEVNDDEVDKHWLAIATGATETSREVAGQTVTTVHQRAVDPAIAWWLVKRARTACEAASPGFEYAVPTEDETSHHDCQVLSEYIVGCKWGQVGNAFVGRRRATWDGADQWRLAIQGRVCCEVLTDRKNRVVKVGVFSAWMAEENFLAERKNRRACEFCYKADLREAREMVRRWEAGENVEFTFVNGQKAGVIEWTDAVGRPKRVSAWGAGLGAGAAVGAPEWADAEALRQWEKEMELDRCVQLAGLWYSPTRECKKVRIAGQWYGTAKVYQVGEVVEGVGTVVAVARG